MLIRPDEKILFRAREEFRYLLSVQTVEQQWQDFFAANPFVLSNALPLRVEPTQIKALGRPGRSEADLIIYPDQSGYGSPYGVIELKRPTSRILSTPRKNILDFSKDARTAIRQAQEYSKTLEREIHQAKDVIVLGNELHIFVVMGLYSELQEKLQSSLFHEQWKGLFPPGVQLLPYDTIFTRFNSGLPQSVVFLTPVNPRTYTNDIGMEFVLIEPGTFLMGSNNGSDDEKPVHEVEITKPFYLGKYPVTQEQWEKVMGDNPSRSKKGPNHPVERVSWNMKEFIEKLNKGTQTYRLPTEAEWEYACRAGTTTEYYYGDDASQLGKYAWYGENAGNTTHPVGQKEPNDWDLHDMLGNVWEWCQDWYGSNYYKSSPVQDPQGPGSGERRVLRGGSFGHPDDFVRCAARFWYYPDYPDYSGGFRLVALP